MVGTKISTGAADSRMLDLYDQLLGLGLRHGIYAGKKRETNRALHDVVVPYIREHHPEYMPAGYR